MEETKQNILALCVVEWQCILGFVVSRGTTSSAEKKRGRLSFSFDKLHERGLLLNINQTRPIGSSLSLSFHYQNELFNQQ